MSNDPKTYEDMSGPNSQHFGPTEIPETFGPKDLPFDKEVALKRGYKHDDGKLDWSLLPWAPIVALVRLFMVGAKKYDKDNWKKGMDYSRCYNALLRHLTAWWNGERLDPETHCHHLTSVMWCALVLLYYELDKKAYGEFDDRPIDGPADRVSWNVQDVADRKLAEMTQNYVVRAYDEHCESREEQITQKLVNRVINRLQALGIIPVEEMNDKKGNE